MYAAIYGHNIDECGTLIADEMNKYATAEYISPQEHIAMQGTIQYYIDSSISKTVNIPEDMPFEDFCQVYTMAYNQGAKGCTTYRPSAVRGAVLTSVKPSKEISLTNGEMKDGDVDPANVPAPAISEETRGVPTFKRPEVLCGTTYKIPWPGLQSPFFVTINNTIDGHPIEVFISSKNDAHNEWSVAMSVMISKLLQAGVSASEVGKDLKGITLSSSTAWHNGKHYGSIIARIGELIAEHKPNPQSLLYAEYASIEQRVLAYYMGAPDLDSQHISAEELDAYTDEVIKSLTLGSPTGRIPNHRCSFCNSLNTRMEEGCLKCSDCGQSKCG
jgi:ribonucleoside-diphosphate reductase alpha chain